MDGHRSHHQRHHSVRWNTQCQQWDERGLRASVVGRFRGCHTANIALTERNFTRLKLGLLFDGVGSKGRQHRAATRQNTQGRTQHRAAHHGREHQLEVSGGRHQAGHLGGKHFALIVGLGQVGNDFTVTEHPHGNHNEVDAVSQLWDIKAVTCHAGIHVGTDHAEQQAQHDHADGLEQRARGQHHGTDQAQHHQREVLSRAKHEGHFSQRRGEGSQDDRTHATCEERANASGCQGRACPAFACHLVAVNHRHHRR